eukprot:scaffold10546_cov59-Phaeocystis_antarctica.AAC.5
MPGRLIVHAGAHKTGTTTTQLFLHYYHVWIRDTFDIHIVPNGKWQPPAYVPEAQGSSPRRASTVRTAYLGPTGEPLRVRRVRRCASGDGAAAAEPHGADLVRAVRRDHRAWNPKPKPKPNPTLTLTLSRCDHRAWSDVLEPPPARASPPAWCTLRRHRAACPEAPRAVCRPYAYQPASAMPYAPRSLAPQAPLAELTVVMVHRHTMDWYA